MGGSDRVISHSNLYDRVSKLLDSYECSDCSFSVDGTIFQAHKLILSISSPVFKAMLYGPLATSDNIVITDIEAKTFQLLINYIYTDRISVETVQQACSLLYAAKKYMLECLAEGCINYIDENTSIDNVITVYNFSEYIQEERLLTHALVLICEHADFILTKNIENISVSCLKAVLEMDKLNMNEKLLIEFVLDWTKLYCLEMNKQPTAENCRNVLLETGILKLLRFLCLTKHDFDEITSSSDLLSNNEVEVISHFLSHTKMDGTTVIEDITKENCLLLCPVMKARDKMKVFSYFCLRNPIRSAPPLLIDELCNKMRVRIKANKSVFINALGIPSRMSPQVSFSNDLPLVYSEHFKVTIRNESYPNSDKVTNYMNTVGYDSTLFVDFAEPYLLNKGDWYCITFAWSESRSQEYRYAISYRNMYCNHRVKFEFDDVTMACGSFLEGLKFSF